MSILNVMYIGKKVNVSYTPFCVPECENKDIYEENKSLLNNKVIVKIDSLQCLEDMFDKGMFINRDLLYRLVSGSNGQSSYGELISSFYKKFPSFSNYIDGAVMFKDDDRNLLQNIMIPIRTKIDEYKATVKSKASEVGGRLVLDTHDYLYIAFDVGKYKEIPGVRIEKVISR